MKKILLLLTTFTFCHLSISAQQFQFLDHSAVSFRSGPVTFNPDWAPFYHGVASGDPLANRVIIWTRVTPEEMNSEPIEVDWKVATDPQLTNIVQSGSFTTNEDRDYTVKVDVTGLEAGQTYYYGFTTMGLNSLTGKTKTTPSGNQSDHLKFGVVSCSNFQAGYFNTYHRLADRTDLDAILHLGDYIYEYADGFYGDATLFEDRPLEPATEIVTLEEYRTRYSTYRLDTNLVRAHQQHPFITVWDDHESANDSYVDGAQNHTPGTEGSWEDRKSAAKQAYFEWLPIRDTDGQEVYRSINYGNIMDLIMLDTRLAGREEQILSADDPDLESPDRTILGSEQREWFLQQLSNATAKWKVVGQQVIFAPFEVGWAALMDMDPQTNYLETQGLAQDIWNGYPAERQAILNFIENEEIDNTVILTGDFHTTFAFDIPKEPYDRTLEEVPNVGLTPIYTPNGTYDPATGAGSLAVEFATPSVTSANFDENFGVTPAFLFNSLINQPITLLNGTEIGNPNPHLKYPQLTNHGYFILDVKPDSVQANYYFNPISTLTEEEALGQAWYTKDGNNHLQAAAAHSGPKEMQDTPAPNDPPLISSTEEYGKSSVFALLGVYPNPSDQSNTLHFSIAEKTMVQVDLLNTEGKLVKELLQQEVAPGTFSLQTDTADLPAGNYFYRIQAGKWVFTASLVKQ